MGCGQKDTNLIIFSLIFLARILLTGSPFVRKQTLSSVGKFIPNLWNFFKVRKNPSRFIELHDRVGYILYKGPNKKGDTMGKLNLKNGVALALLMVQAPSVFAVGYDGPRVDYNFIYQEPSQYKICDQYANLETYKACDTAHDSAKSFASRFGGQEGKLEGYLRGYSWGLYKAVNAFQNNSQVMDEGARAVNTLDGYLARGIQAGQAQGSKDGSVRGQQEARNRFHAAVNTGKFPSKEILIPGTSYEGESNAYAKYVGSIPTVEQILKEDSNLGDLPIYGSFNGTILRERENRSPFYYWFSDGTYRFETRFWDEGPAALETWTKRSGDQNVIAYDRYVADPAIDPSTGKRLVEIFRDSFVKTYQYYVSFYFSVNFQQNIDQGQLVGEALGTQIGKRIAQTKGLAKAFDVKFKESSKASYRGSFESSYRGDFNSVFDDYANNPKISIDLVDVIGADNDGIIQPGENFSVLFKVVNAGGRGTGLNVSVSGNVQNGQVLTNYQIGALTGSQIQTETIGQIDPRLSPRETAQITLNVNGIRDTFGQVVNRLVEIRGQGGSLNILKGAGQITIDAENLATVATPGVVSAELKLKGRTYTEVAGQLGAGAVQRILLSYTGLDPLELITGEAVAVVSLKHNDTVLDTREIKLGSSSRVEDLVSYFDQVANGKGTLASGVSAAERTEELKRILASWNSSEVDRNSGRGGHNMYRKEPETTIVGKLARTFTASVQSESAKEQYDLLAKVLIKEREKFKSFIGIAPKRSHYTDLVRTFSKNKKLK